jgi:16S rRNA (cytidine1402-2'-O)-methyltransferase
LNSPELTPALYVIGTPIGNLQDITLRALETLKRVDVIYCEDTRRTIKLLNAYEIRKPLKACPHFREKIVSDGVVEQIRGGERVGFVTDAGMPGISDPGERLVAAVRSAGLPVNIIGGVSALTHFLAGLGAEIDSFRFIGFLPARQKEREDLFRTAMTETLIFMESPHRIESTLKILCELKPETNLIFGKELSKISEQFYSGTPDKVVTMVKSFKGEWMGCLIC